MSHRTKQTLLYDDGGFKTPWVGLAAMEVEVHLYWVPFFSQLTLTQGALSPTQYVISNTTDTICASLAWVRPSNIRVGWIQMLHTAILIHPCCKTSYGFVKILCIKGRKYEKRSLFLSLKWHHVHKYCRLCLQLTSEWMTLMLKSSLTLIITCVDIIMLERGRQVLSCLPHPTQVCGGISLML